jgi:Lysozyme like domain
VKAVRIEALKQIGPGSRRKKPGPIHFAPRRSKHIPYAVPCQAMLVGRALLAPRGGLAASCSPVLTTDQVYSIALAAGFPPDTATEMVAIAMRESSLCPTAHNPGTLGVTEDSYGLWQINVDANPQVVSALGLSSPSQLLDPNVNAAAAYMLWGGNDANLNTLWAINQTGPPYYYAEKYQANLPAAQAAAARVNASGGSAPVVASSSIPDASTDTSTSATSLVSTVGADLSSMVGGSVTLFGYQVPIMALAGGGLAIVILLMSLTSSRRR